MLANNPIKLSELKITKINDPDIIDMSQCVVPCKHFFSDTKCKFGFLCKHRHPKCHLAEKCKKYKCPFSHKFVKCNNYPLCKYGNHCKFFHGSKEDYEKLREELDKDITCTQQCPNGIDCVDKNSVCKLLHLKYTDPGKRHVCRCNICESLFDKFTYNMCPCCADALAKDQEEKAHKLK